MSPDRDDRNDDLQPEAYDEEPPRSIFAATWFRAVLVLIILGVIGAVAVPYILDAVNPPPTQQAVVKSAPLPTPPPSPPPSPSQVPADAVTSAPAESPSLPPAQRSTSPAPAMAQTPRPSAPLAKTDVPVERPPAPRAKAEPATPPTNGAAKSSMSKSSAATADSAPKKTAPATSTRTGTKPVAKKPPESRQMAARTASGTYWVQVGAFKDEETAKRLAARLREQNFKVADIAASAPAPAASAPTAPPTPAGADQYDVFVTGLPPAELATRLTAKGLASETSGTGVVIKPSLPLRDAVALSKDLAVDGLKVQVRRAGGTAAAPRPKQAPAADGLYRVRVGSFNDRAAAMATLRELEAKGYKPFIARGER